MSSEKLMRHALALARRGMRSAAGGPFGALVVRGHDIIGEGFNEVTSLNDPTAHAEIQAIRKACQKLGTFLLTDCDIYTSCEPCPMCLGAIYWARPRHVFFAGTRTDAAQAGFIDDHIYREIVLSLQNRTLPFSQLLREEALKVFEEWILKTDKKDY